MSRPGSRPARPADARLGCSHLASHRRRARPRPCAARHEQPHRRTAEARPSLGRRGRARGWAPRVKTRRPQLLEVPTVLRPVLRDWWERQGRPTAALSSLPCAASEPVKPRARSATCWPCAATYAERWVETWSTERRRFEAARALTPHEVELFADRAHGPGGLPHVGARPSGRRSPTPP